MPLSSEPNNPGAPSTVLFELEDEGSVNTRKVDDALSEIQFSHARTLLQQRDCENLKYWSFIKIFSAVFVSSLFFG